MDINRVLLQWSIHFFNKKTYSGATTLRNKSAAKMKIRQTKHEKKKKTFSFY